MKSPFMRPRVRLFETSRDGFYKARQMFKKRDPQSLSLWHEGYHLFVSERGFLPKCQTVPFVPLFPVPCRLASGGGIAFTSARLRRRNQVRSTPYRPGNAGTPGTRERSIAPPDARGRAAADTLDLQRLISHRSPVPGSHVVSGAWRFALIQPETMQLQSWNHAIVLVIRG